MALAADGGMRVLVVPSLVAIAIVGLHAPRALACSTTPSPYATIDAVEPADGSTGFPRNGAIRVTLNLWPVTDSNDSAQPEVRVSVADTDERVEGVVNLFTRDSGYITWVPNVPLRANTRYRIDATTTTLPRDGFDGPTHVTSTFTTTDALAPDLELIGGLRATLRRAVVDSLQCGPCGMCNKVGERAALLADVELPIVQAGFDPYGYQAWLSFNDESAPVWNGPGEGKLTGEHEIGLGRFVRPAAGMRNTVTQELPIVSRAYTACFGFNVWDPIGHSKSAESVCIPASEVGAAFAALDSERESNAADAGVNLAMDAGTAGAAGLGADPNSPTHASVNTRDGGPSAATPADSRDPVGGDDNSASAKHVSSGVGCSIALRKPHDVGFAALIPVLALLQRARRRLRS
jgi:hypothetical protein